MGTSIVFLVFFRILAIRSPETSDYRRLLIYWVVYSSLTYIEYFGRGLFNLLLIPIDCLGYCLSHSAIFYWLAKCIFLVWFLNSGSRMISRCFAQETVPETEKFECEYTLRIKLII
jgi:hypothetical protein